MKSSFRKGNRKKHNYPDSDKSLPLRTCPICNQLQLGWNYFTRRLECKNCGYINDKTYKPQKNNFDL